MKVFIPIAALLLVLSGCASNPSIAKLRGNARTATFVQYGHVPLHYSFGVVDTASFWANYGSGVSVNLGGSLLAEGAAASGQVAVSAREAKVQKIMAHLYGHDQLDNKVAKDVIPELARAWNVPYRRSALHVIPVHRRIVNKKGQFDGLRAHTDLVLLYVMTNLELTEKPSLAAALKAGFTLGTYTKHVAAQPTVSLNAFRRQPDGGYKLIWTGTCVGAAGDSPIAYPFPAVIKSEAKARNLWQAAVKPTEHSCAQVLAMDR